MIADDIFSLIIGFHILTDNLGFIGQGLIWFELRKPLLLVPPISWWSWLRVSQLSWGVPPISFYPTTFWKRMLPRLGLEPTPPDFQSDVLSSTPLGQGGKCSSMGGEQSSLQYPAMLTGVTHSVSLREVNPCRPPHTLVRPGTGWDQYDHTVPSRIGGSRTESSSNRSTIIDWESHYC